MLHSDSFNTKLKLQFLLFYLLCCATFSWTTLVEDYVSLINNEVAKSEKYQLPKNHSELFRRVYDKNSTKEYGTFDFIVVGAGSSGAIVAKRLSESKFKVLLLEAGTAESNFTIIPDAAKSLQNSIYNWGYYTTPQYHICQAMVNHQCPAVSGKALGGSSAINYMIYSRPNKNDHNSWRSFGITGWDWRDVLPYYKKLENYQNIYLDPGFHGFSGLIGIDYSRSSNYLVDIYLEANKEVDKLTEDYNGAHFFGTGKTQYNIFNGKRASTASFYLNNITEEYLEISTKSYVYKILIDQNDDTFGVEFLKNKRRYVAYAKHEVILSAGTLNTPQLLMLSGIGPKLELDKHNIPLRRDLPVGLNMKDHVVFFGLRFESNFTMSSGNIPLEQNVWEFLNNNAGPLTDIGLQAVSFISTEPEASRPDIVLLLNPHDDSPFALANKNYMLPEYIVNLEEPDVNLRNVFTTTIILLSPKSRGTVKLSSSNVEAFPLIDPNSLSVTEDVERIYKAIKYVLELLETKAFKKIDAKLIQTRLTPCSKFDYLSEEYWYCTIKHLSANYHSTGTCSMGNSTRKSVVDSHLRVHGIKKLRVADLSVVPQSPSAHTNALAMMIGEKAADIIKAEYIKNMGNVAIPTWAVLFFIITICVSTITYRST